MTAGSINEVNIKKALKDFTIAHPLVISEQCSIKSLNILHMQSVGLIIDKLNHFMATSVDAFLALELVAEHIEEVVVAALEVKNRFSLDTTIALSNDKRTKYGEVSICTINLDADSHTKFADIILQ